MSDLLRKYATGGLDNRWGLVDAPNVFLLLALSPSGNGTLHGGLFAEEKGRYALWRGFRFQRVMTAVISREDWDRAAIDYPSSSGSNMGKRRVALKVSEGTKFYFVRDTWHGSRGGRKSEKGGIVETRNLAALVYPNGDAFGLVPDRSRKA